MSDRAFSLPLSTQRRLVNDLVHFAHRIPTVPVQRLIDVGKVADLRLQAARRVSWAAVFTKAYALVSEQFPCLRRAYLEYPRPRLYQHPCPIASVAVEREFDGELGVFFAQLPRPDVLPLAELEIELQRFKTAPVEEAFKFQLLFARFPRMVRRFAWWWILNVRGSRKAEFLGTFGVSVYSSLGAESLHPLSPLTTTLNYGVVGPDGMVPVRIIYDHRAMDGAMIARALGCLQTVLQGPITDELAALGSPAPADSRKEPSRIITSPVRTEGRNGAVTQA